MTIGLLIEELEELEELTEEIGILMEKMLAMLCT